MQIEQIAADAATESRAAFTADPKAFEAAAAFLAKRVIERRNSMPILSHIRIEATPAGAVILSGTDLDQLARVTIAADVESPGAICVEAGPLADALAKLRKGGAWEVRFADKGECRAKVNASGVRAAFDLRALPADDFPATVAPTVDEALSAFTVAAAPFLSDLAALAPCISTEETRYYLNGIALQVRDMAERPRLILAATDGHNMAVASRPIPVGAEALADSILPRKAVANLAHAAKVAGNVEAIAVEFEGDRAARFTLGPVEIETKLIDGTFPDWSRPFEGQLAPTVEQAAPLFPELVAGAPLAAMAKLEKGAGQAIEWQDAASGRIGSIAGDPGLVFGCMAVAAVNEPVKGFRYGYDHDRGVAGRYLSDMAVKRHGPIPFAWSKRLEVIDGEAVGLTIGKTEYVPGRHVERQNWETLTVEQVWIEGETIWEEGSYSAVMPREDRRQLGPDVTLQIDGDGTVYPIAQNSAGAIHLTADQVARMAGEADTRTIEVRTRGGRMAHVYAAVWEAGALYLEPCKASGAEIRKGFAVHSQIARADVVWTSADGELNAAEPVAEAAAVEAPEFAAPAAAESEEAPIVAQEGGEALNALSGPEIAPEEVAADPVADLAARVAALEARLEALAVETGPGIDQREDSTWRPASNGAGKHRWGAARFGGREWAENESGRVIRVSSHEAAQRLADRMNEAESPSGEAARPKRTAAHERAIRRAWAERKARRGAQGGMAIHARRIEALERELRLAQGEQALDKQALAEAYARAEHYYANWKEEARREGIQGGRRANSTLRARRMILAARQAATFQRQRADVLAAQLDKLRADMADPVQPERASDIARLVRERDEARNAAAATSARNASLQAALNSLGDKLEEMAVKVTMAERGARGTPYRRLGAIVG